MRHSDIAPAKSGAGIGVLNIHSAHDTRLACFLFVRPSNTSMVSWAGASSEALVPCDASTPTLSSSPPGNWRCRW
ncbi:ash family protein [Serratia marcescens]|nr:ash family protein [Serratia marcescens]QNQ56856.1 ash family protein [Serratia liquefaciens]